MVTDPEFMEGLLGNEIKGQSQVPITVTNMNEQSELKDRKKFSKSKNSYNNLLGGKGLKSSVLSAGGTRHRRNESGINFFDVESRNSYEVHVESDPTLRNDLL